MKKGNLVRVKSIPDRDTAGNPILEHLAVYLGEEKIINTTVYEVLILGEAKPYQISSNFWELEKL